MKSTSGNDGSYTLTVTFAVGTDPDINTVNVQNRVQPGRAAAARRGAAPRASASRRSRRRSCRSSRLTSPDGRYDQLFLSATTPPSTSSTSSSASPASATSCCSAPSDYSMRIWLNTDRLTSFGLTPNDIANALKRQNIQAAVGRIGAQPALPDQQFQLNIQTKGRLDQPSRSSATSWCAPIPDGSFVRVRDVGAGRAWRARPSELVGRLQRQPGGRDRRLSRRPAPTRSTAPTRVQATLHQLQGVVPGGRRLQDHLRHHGLRAAKASTR